MKILHICLCGQFNENLSYQDNIITKYHSLSGNDVVIIAPTLKLSDDGTDEIFLDPLEKKINNNIKLYRIPYFFNLKIIYKLRIYKGLQYLLKKEHPDFIFIHGTQFIDIRLVANYLKKNPHVVAVADNHSDYYNSARNLLSRIFLHKLLWRCCTHTILPYVKKIYGVTPLRCTFLKDVYRVPNNKVELLPLAADDLVLEKIQQEDNRITLREKLGFKQDDFILVTGGKIDDNKNIHKIVSSIKGKFDKTNIKLVYFGSFSDKCSLEIKNYLKHVTDGHNIIYKGWLNSEEIYKMFLLSDVAIFPGLHSVLWEQAIATGIPCIFNELEGFEHLSEKGNALLVNGNDEKEIEEAIVLMYHDEKLYYRLKYKSVEASKSFRYSEISKKVLIHE
ncbi:glycosyltransferase [Riemerella anatipestifer]|uniref:glycosyltransferase n=1 Tax=Riemerella anatipestifer TaxID=34085 RepID=UPI00129DB075|nr:glycosyltransferase [Riemerella anatipestifer]MRM93455.1 glycosyltransferase [Riemerella anatipestifer]